MLPNSNIQNGSIENRIPDLAASILPASSGNERSGKQVYSIPSSMAIVPIPPKYPKLVTQQVVM